MAVKPNDARRLWGRAGAHCALCNLELSPMGDGALVGEIAHIVAQAEKGPRGSHPLPLADRDRYDNLILLCPNDHAHIDAREDEWSVERLQAEKLRHEQRVQELLDKGAASPVNIDSSPFREERIARWAAERGSWMYVALTPLLIADDAIDPLADALRLRLTQCRLPPLVQGLFGVTFNSYTLEPSARGLVTEDFSRRKDGVAYRLEVFREGHIEYAICLSELVGRFTPEDEAARNPLARRPPETRRVPCARLLEYQKWAATLVAQLRVLHTLWGELPFKDMIVTTAMCGVEGTCLWVDSDPYEYLTGRAVEERVLRYAAVFPKTCRHEDVIAVMLTRFVTYFGLTLPSAFDEQGQVRRPLPLGQPQ